MFLVLVNISTFCFSPYKIFLQLLVPIFKLIFVFFNEIVQKCEKYCKTISQKNNFFYKTQIKYETLNINNKKIHIKFMFC